MIKDLELFEFETYTELQELSYDGDDFVNFED